MMALTILIRRPKPGVMPGRFLTSDDEGLAGPNTFGLVVQGGGMRGVYSMGALAALEEMGFGECFDHVAGSSAGALNGAYFITGQASYGVETYIHYLSRKKVL